MRSPGGHGHQPLRFIFGHREAAAPIQIRMGWRAHGVKDVICNDDISLVSVSNAPSQPDHFPGG
jgi:hypothetical protein